MGNKADVKPASAYAVIDGKVSGCVFCFFLGVLQILFLLINCTVVLEQQCDYSQSVASKVDDSKGGAQMGGHERARATVARLEQRQQQRRQ